MEMQAFPAVSSPLYQMSNRIVNCVPCLCEHFILRVSVLVSSKGSRALMSRPDRCLNIVKLENACMCEMVFWDVDLHLLGAQVAVFL